MPQTVVVEQTYNVSAETLWENILDFGALEASMADQAVYEGLPDHPPEIGDVYDIRFRRHGLFQPTLNWRIEIVGRDDQRFHLQSAERGGVIKRWDHTLSVTPIVENQCLYRDNVIVDAGVLTPIIARMCRSNYVKRHAARKALLNA